MDCDEHGRVWFGTRGQGLTMFDGEQWYNWSTANRDDMERNGVSFIVVSSEKVYGSALESQGRDGVTVYDIEQDLWTDSWPEENELSGAVTSIAIDSQGDVYFSTEDGILDICDSNGQWQHIAMDLLPPDWQLLTGNSLVDANGHYWLATDCFGIWEYDGEQWRTHDPDQVFTSECSIVNRIALDRQGQLWVASEYGLMVKHLNGQWESYPCTGDCEFNEVAVDPQGRVWGATEELIYVFDSESWALLSPNIVGKSKWGSAIAFDAQGRAWIGLESDGVAVFSGELDTQNATDEPFLETPTPMPYLSPTAEPAVSPSPRPSISSDVPISIADPNLEAAIRKTIGKPSGSILQSDVASMTTLDASGQGIVRLDGIQYCSALTELRLGVRLISRYPLPPPPDEKYNYIADLTPLSALRGLTTLSLDHNAITDLRPLSSLGALKTLHLMDNEITDCTPLASLTSLYELNLAENRVASVAPLAKLSNLDELVLDDNSVVDMAPIAYLTNLTELSAESNAIVDLSALSGLAHLNLLRLDDNRISDISALSDLTNLYSLDLCANQITDISPLAGLTRLHSLMLQANRIVDISPLSNLVNLVTLGLGQDSPTLAGSTISVGSLHIGGNEIIDLAPLSGLSQLNWLSVDRNRVSDLTPLHNLMELSWLSLNWNQIRDVSPLSSLTGLATLELACNHISDVSPLTGLTKLMLLGLAGNEINDMSPLSQNEGLGNNSWGHDVLDLSDNPLGAASTYGNMSVLGQRGVRIILDTAVDCPSATQYW